MTNNDILRRLRYCFDLNDKQMLALFALADYPVHPDQLIDWLRKDEDPAFERCGDHQLEHFLDGLIIHRRGPKDGPRPALAKTLSRNLVLRKLRIALNARDEDMLAIFALAEFPLSKHELSALFRRPDHPHYRECKDQLMRNFLTGLQLKLRSKESPSGNARPAKNRKPAHSKPARKAAEKPPARQTQRTRIVVENQTAQPATTRKKLSLKKTDTSGKKVNSNIWGS